jgi:hypothetical protein
MEYLQSLGPTLLLTVGGAVGGLLTWIIKSKIEELKAIEEKLREDRRKIYEQILDPYIQLLTDVEDSKEAMKKITSFKYKKTSFNLYLFGSDSVIRIHNQLMQYAFKNEAAKTQDNSVMMLLWGKFLLEIRKSLGNKRTKLNELNMLEGWIKDIEKIRK